MKKIFRSIILWILKILAKKRLKTFNGKIIAVTGSIGKTSTKDAIRKVLNRKYRVKYSKKSMNSDFGLILTILDIESGFSSATKWIWYLTKAFIHSFTKIHYEILLLETGVDKKGDMDFLLSIVKPDIAIFTNVSTVHMDEGQFDSLEDVFEEKSKLIFAVKEGGSVILNMDDEYVQSLSKKCAKRKVLGYGKNPDSNYRFSNITSSIEGIKFSLFHKDSRHLIQSKILGKHHAYVLSPAFICGQILDIDEEIILDALNKYHLSPGRMSLIPGLEGISILDSSYNSSPVALIESIKLLTEVADKNQRKVAVLGQMNELGTKSEALHRAVAPIIAKNVDLLIAVHKDAAFFAEEAKKKGMPEINAQFFNSTKEAIEFYKSELKPNDLVLVKGSQNRVRLERFVKKFMLDKDNAKDLLVRQEKEWQVKL